MDDVMELGLVVSIILCMGFRRLRFPNQCFHLRHVKR